MCANVCGLPQYFLAKLFRIIFPLPFCRAFPINTATNVARAAPTTKATTLVETAD